MPWVVAMEINKLLKIGGLTCHLVPFAWPGHDRPWDFWRYSDEGMKVLFSPAMGFEVIEAGVHSPLRMYFDKLEDGYEAFAEAPSFGGASILARKVSELDPDKFKWDVQIEDVVGSSSHYPPPDE